MSEKKNQSGFKMPSWAVDKDGKPFKESSVKTAVDFSKGQLIPRAKTTYHVTLIKLPYDRTIDKNDGSQITLNFIEVKYKGVKKEILTNGSLRFGITTIMASNNWNDSQILNQDIDLLKLEDGTYRVSLS